MLEITSLKNGLVIDHIKAGLGVKIFNYLKLDTTKYSVALIINAESSQLGRKDIIKIERDKCEEIDYTVLGLLSPSITINEIKNEKIIRKIRPTLPKKVENIIVCNNPNCIDNEGNRTQFRFVIDDHIKFPYNQIYRNTRRVICVQQ